MDVSGVDADRDVLQEKSVCMSYAVLLIKCIIAGAENAEMLRRFGVKLVYLCEQGEQLIHSVTEPATTTLNV